MDEVWMQLNTVLIRRRKTLSDLENNIRISDSRRQKDYITAACHSLYHQC